MPDVQKRQVASRPRARAGPAAKVTAEERRRYVELVRAGVSKGDAATMLDRSPQSFSRIAKADAGFAAELEAAWVEGAEPLIQEAERRGREGWEEPVFGRLKDGTNGVVGYTRKYSDNLLMFSIKGRRPEYKENPRIDLRAGVTVEIEDRTGPLEQLGAFLRSLGVSPELANGSARGELPVVEGSVAEPRQLQPAAGGVPGSSEP